MNIMVTGASGFIGANLSEAFSNSDKNKIYALTRKTTSLEKLPKKVIPIVFESSCELTNTLIKLDIEGIIHLASYFVAEHKAIDIDGLIDANITFGTHVIESAVKADVSWFLNTSSYWQHYKGEQYNPVALYSATKQAFEDILRFYRETSPIKLLNIELFDTYGPNDNRLKLFNLLINSLGCGETLKMSPGNQKLNLVYIDDVISAYRLLVYKLSENSKMLLDNYSISSPDLFTLKEVVETFSRIFQGDIRVEWGGRPYRAREIMNPTPSYANIPGCYNKFNLEQGISKLYEAFNETCIH